MKKTLLSFVFIFSVVFAFGQAQNYILDDFEVVTLEQDTFNLQEFWMENPDKKVALEFFFTDSPLCKEISPIISEAYRKFGCNEHDVFFLSINVSDDSTSIVNYRDTLNIETPVVMSSMGGVTVDTLAAIHAYPTLVLLQKEIFTMVVDTIIEEGDTEEENDTTIVYEETNYLERDIWPIYNIDSLTNVLLSHGINENECSESGSNNSTGVEEVSFDQGFHLFPNPNDGNFYIKSSIFDGDFEIEILDLRGKSLFIRNYRKIKNVPYQIQRLDLNTGIYVLRIRHNNESWSEKLIIQ